jgi:hypothetical protein
MKKVRITEIWKNDSYFEYFDQLKHLEWELEDEYIIRDGEWYAGTLTWTVTGEFYYFEGFKFEEI